MPYGTSGARRIRLASSRRMDIRNYANFERHRSQFEIFYIISRRKNSTNIFSDYPFSIMECAATLLPASGKLENPLKAGMPLEEFSY